MLPQIRPPRVHATPPWSTASVASIASVADESRWDVARERWMAAFSQRLAELRPHDDADALRAVAADLWVDVGGHDPVIAAEMEFEASSG